MKNMIIATAFFVIATSAFAGTKPEPRTQAPSPRYERQEDYRYENSREDYRGGGSTTYENRYSTGRYSKPEPRPVPRPTCNRACPAPRPSIPLNCRVVMVDPCDRIIYTYNGLADLPSGICSGALRQCQRDIRAENQYDARCFQLSR